jgi:signal peptidase I
LAEPKQRLSQINSVGVIVLYLVFIGAFIISLIVLRQSFGIVRILGESMNPTLRHDDWVLIFRYFPARFLKRGWIVVHQNSNQNQLRPSMGDNSLIKRIVALPDDTVEYSADELLPMIQEEHYETLKANGKLSWYIPEKYYFLKGDALGIDSTMLGPLPMKDMYGLVIRKIQLKNNTK